MIVGNTFIISYVYGIMEYVIFRAKIGICVKCGQDREKVYVVLCVLMFVHGRG